MSRRVHLITCSPSLDRYLEVDHLRSGGIHRPARVAERGGGKGLNALRVARTVGAVECVLVGPFGGGTGDQCATYAADAGVEVRAVNVVASTRVCTQILDRSNSVVTEFYEPLGSIADDEWTHMVDAVAETCDAAAPEDIVVISGRVPDTATGDHVDRLVAAVGVTRSPVAVDASGRLLAAALELGPWLVKINLDEAYGVVGAMPMDANVVSAGWGAINQLCGRWNPTNVVITLGGHGAVANLSDSGRFLATGPQVDPAYAVGSGDALFGALLAANDMHVISRECLERAVAAATANTRVFIAGDFEYPAIDAEQPNVTVRHLGF